MQKDLIEFAKQYQAMRDQQNRYFKTRYTEDLNKAKKMEKDLDARAREIIEADLKSKQPNLFK